MNPSLSAGPLIAGERITRSSGGTHRHVYPATGQPNASVQLAGAAEIDEAVASAWEAHREWMSRTVDRRRDLLIDLADAVHDNLDELAPWKSSSRSSRARGSVTHSTPAWYSDR